MGRRVRVAGMAALALLLSGFAARAADLITYPTSSNQSLPVAEAPGGFDWSGFYAGVYGAYQPSAATGDRFGIGIDAGVNATFDFVLAGAEVAVQGLYGSGNAGAYAQVTGRAGLLVGDGALLYGAAGYGLDTSASNSGDVMAGGGVEFAVTDALSLRAQYLRAFPVAGSATQQQVTLGAQFHF